MKPYVKVIILDGKRAFKAECPNCGLKQFIDEDQFYGRVSMQCTTPTCTYHETHDISKDFASL